MHEKETQLKTVLTKADDSIMLEIIRQAEVYLESQLTAGIASDQRASSFASMLGAALAALAAGAGALLLNSPILAIPLFPAAVGFLVAIGKAISASEPTIFHYRGNTPGGWVDDVNSKKTLTVSLAEQAAHYEGSIESNGQTLEKSCKLMQSAIQWAWRSFVVSLSLGVVVVPAKLVVDNWGAVVSFFCPR